MTRLVIDANIIFAAIHNRNSETRRRLLLSEYTFYSPNFLITELFKHKERIALKAKATDDELLEFLNRVIQRIHFINEELISIENFIEAYHLCKDIDEKDTPYVALSLEFDANIWTRDNELKEGLRAKGFDRFIDEQSI